MSTLRRTLTALGLVAGLAAAYPAYRLVGPGRYAELEHLQARLEALPGVKLVKTSGHGDVTFEVDGFTLDVEGRGEIAFGPLDRDSFEHTGHLSLQAIGGHEVVLVMEGFLGVTHAETGEPLRSIGRGGGIDVGPEGAFARFFPFPLSNVQQVLDRYEAICAELGQWPVQPEYGTFEDDEGTRYFYAVKDPSSEEDGIHPTELGGE